MKSCWWFVVGPSYSGVLVIFSCFRTYYNMHTNITMHLSFVRWTQHQRQSTPWESCPKHMFFLQYTLNLMKIAHVCWDGDLDLFEVILYWVLCGHSFQFIFNSSEIPLQTSKLPLQTSKLCKIILSHSGEPPVIPSSPRDPETPDQRCPQTRYFHDTACTTEPFQGFFEATQLGQNWSFPQKKCSKKSGDVKRWLGNIFFSLLNSYISYINLSENRGIFPLKPCWEMGFQRCPDFGCKLWAIFVGP